MYGNAGPARLLASISVDWVGKVFHVLHLREVAASRRHNAAGHAGIWHWAVRMENVVYILKNGLLACLDACKRTGWESFIFLGRLEHLSIKFKGTSRTISCSEYLQFSLLWLFCINPSFHDTKRELVIRSTGENQLLLFILDNYMRTFGQDGEERLYIIVNCLFLFCLIADQ